MNDKRQLKEELEDCYYDTINEGFDYCFDGYSNWDNITDGRFHILRENYLKSKKELNDYLKSHVSKLNH